MNIANEFKTRIQIYPLYQYEKKDGKQIVTVVNPNGLVVQNYKLVGRWQCTRIKVNVLRNLSNK